jgi:hypothetical protein
MPSPLTPPQDTADTPSLAALAVAYPGFTISRDRRGWRGPRWTATRRNSADPGLYALVTTDLSELCTALRQDQSQDNQHPPPALHPHRDHPRPRPPPITTKPKEDQPMPRAGLAQRIRQQDLPGQHGQAAP